MNILDRAIAAFAPGLGLRRAAARDMLRSYGAGTAGRLTQGWMPHRGAPNAALEAGRPLLTARSRDLGRNNPWATSALRRLPAAIVGTGPVASPQVTGKAARKQVAEDWAEFCDAGDLDGALTWDAALHLAVRTVVELGECFIVWQVVAGTDRRVPLGWRLLPPDYLDAVRFGPVAGGGVVRDGIQYNADGTVAGYWFFDRHPADPTPGLRPPTSEFCPAAQVDHVFERLWIGQRRGAPWLAPVAVIADDLAQYEVAALWKARMAASLGLVIETGGPTPTALGAQTQDANGRALETLAPGMVARLKPGEKATQLSPPADENFRQFWSTRLYAIGAGLGLPYASLSGDLSGANYSSLREGKLLFWELLDVWQQHMVVAQVLRPAWRRFARARYAAGRTAGGIAPAVKWAFPRRPWVDPKKDVEALEAELRLGLTSWPDAVAARGDDAEAQLEEIAAFRPRLEAAGIQLVPKPAGPGLGHNGGPSPDDDTASGGTGDDKQGES